MRRSWGQPICEKKLMVYASRSYRQQFSRRATEGERGRGSGCVEGGMLKNVTQQPWDNCTRRSAKTRSTRRTYCERVRCVPCTRRNFVQQNKGMSVAIIDRLQWRAPFSRYIQYGVKRSALSSSTLAPLSFISVVRSMARSPSCRSCFDSCCSDTSGAFIRKWFSFSVKPTERNSRDERGANNRETVSGNVLRAMCKPRLGNALHEVCEKILNKINSTR